LYVQKTSLRGRSAGGDEDVPPCTDSGGARTRICMGAIRKRPTRRLARNRPSVGAAAVAAHNARERASERNRPGRKKESDQCGAGGRKRKGSGGGFRRPI